MTKRRCTCSLGYFGRYIWNKDCLVHGRPAFQAGQPRVRYTPGEPGGPRRPRIWIPMTFGAILGQIAATIYLLVTRGCS